MLDSPLSLPDKRELIVDFVAGDDTVQFLWVLLSCDITEEDDAIYRNHWSLVDNMQFFHC